MDSINHAIIEALNARDYETLAAKVHEDVAIAGIGGGSDTGREALRDRLARHFEATDESYEDALVMSDALGNNIAIKLTARGKGGSAEKILLLETEDGLVTRFAFFSI